MIARDLTNSLDSEPTWEIARLFPSRGEWGEGDFLQLNRQTNRRVELSDGSVEVLEMPTRSHKRIVVYLHQAIYSVVQQNLLGEVIIAPFPVRLWKGKFREPDLLYVAAEHADRLQEDYAEGADLVIEVTSEDRRRDLETKRDEYERAGINEYWIVDAREQKIIMLSLQAGRYVTHAESGIGQTITSLLLPRFSVSVADVFASAGAR
jgi:Uma2 family endonuclease